jgi:putative membrane protein
MMGYGGLAGMGLFGPTGMLIGIVIWVVVIALTIWGVSALFSGRRGQQRQEDPLTILKRRYAHGEIDKQEYDEVKQTLA